MRPMHQQNCAVINSLPATDDEWPFFTRSMFSVPELGSDQDSVRGLRAPYYESIAIAFAGSYKNMYLLDAAWIRKFERLLSRLCWMSARVYNDFGSVVFTWDVDHDGVMQMLQSESASPPTRWLLTCKGLNRQELKVDGIVDGDYEPFFLDPDFAK
jgi:hypothetical protein